MSISRLKLAGIITTEGRRKYPLLVSAVPASSSLESSRLKAAQVTELYTFVPRLKLAGIITTEGLGEMTACTLSAPPQARWNHHD